MPRTCTKYVANTVDFVCRPVGGAVLAVAVVFARLRRVKVVVPAETRPGERRVAAVPESVARLVKAGLEVLVESGAGRHAFLEDSDYSAVGATTGTGDVLSGADVVLHVSPLTPDQVGRLGRGAVTIGFLAPTTNARRRPRRPRRGRHGAVGGAAAAHLPRPVHGRTHVAGPGVRLPSGARGR